MSFTSNTMCSYTSSEMILTTKNKDRTSNEVNFLSSDEGGSGYTVKVEVKVEGLRLRLRLRLKVKVKVKAWVN